MHKFLENKSSNLETVEVGSEEYNLEERDLEKETLPHMELHRQRIETGIVSNFLIKDKGVKYPCLILEGITLSCTVMNLYNQGLLSVSEEESNIPKVTMYFKIEDKVKELRDIDWCLENMVILQRLDKNLRMNYYESESLPPRTPSVEDLLRMEVIDL